MLWGPGVSPRQITLVWLRQSRQWSLSPTPAQSLCRLQRHSVEQLRPTKPKWQRQWSGSTHEPFTQPWAQTGRHRPVTLRGRGGWRQGEAAGTPPPTPSSSLLRPLTPPTPGAGPWPWLPKVPYQIHRPCPSPLTPPPHPRHTPLDQPQHLDTWDCFLPSSLGPHFTLSRPHRLSHPTVCLAPLPSTPPWPPVWLQPHLSMV